jgi:beta-N-acetylhexosaminidase
VTRARPRVRRLPGLLLAGTAAAIAAGAPAATAAGDSKPRHPRTAAALHPGAGLQGDAGIRRAVGQKIMTGMAGTAPSRRLLRRIRLGHVGGVILFADDVTPSLRRTLARLQRAARAGGNPPLLIAVDQEGGAVRRIADAPPARAPAAMTAPGAEGTATGRALRARGINVDLAPVADVGTAGFLGSRSFGSSPARVATAACRFARGLERSRVAATFKHFPGLGRSSQNTDLRAVTLGLSRGALMRDLEPYRRCRPELVMVSNATYPALDPARPAVFSPAVVQGLLRGELGYRGVTISDTLAAPGVASPGAALRASRAGIDILLYIDETLAARAYVRLLAAVRAGRLPAQAVLDSARRIGALPR